MMRNSPGTALIIMGILLVGTIGYCSLTSYSWHQKMTLEVEVDGEVYTGSSVGSVGVMRSDPITSQLGSPLQKGSRGEAAYVELPGQRYVFALLNGGPPGSDLGNIAIKVFRDLLPKGSPELFATLSNLRLMREVPPEYFPLLVTFTDITDSKTIQLGDPNDLAATFGPGVSLKRITLEITDEPVTEGRINQVLGWWLAQRTDRHDPPHFRVPNDNPRGYKTVGVTKFIKGNF